MTRYIIKKMSNNNCTIPNNQISKPVSLDQINEFESAPKEIGSAIKGLIYKQLHYQISAREWNINQVIIHLADTEMFFYQRFRKIIAENKPILQTFDQDEWANHLPYDNQDYKLALNLLIAQRKSSAGLLRLLPKEAWVRTGVKDNKEITLHDIFMIASHHIPTHLEQINKIKKDPHFPHS